MLQFLAAARSDVASGDEGSVRFVPMAAPPLPLLLLERRSRACSWDCDCDCDCDADGDDDDDDDDDGEEIVWLGRGECVARPEMAGRDTPVRLLPCARLADSSPSNNNQGGRKG